MMNNQISLREREVLHLIAYEYSSKEIAAQLYISTHTVISHRKNLLEKLSAKNTAGLIRRAFEENMFSSTNSIDEQASSFEQAQHMRLYRYRKFKH